MPANYCSVRMWWRSAEAGDQLVAEEFEGPASSVLRSLGRASQDVAAALGQEGAYNQRLALTAVGERLDGLLRELTRSSQPYVRRFRPVVEQWRQLVVAYTRRLAEEAERRQEISNPYVLAFPLTPHQDLFVGRTDIGARLEQLLFTRQCPPILIYGQRRMGKTSLLNNLGRLVPSTIIPLFVDLQGPVSVASDHAGFLYNLARAMATSARRQRDLVLPRLTREDVTADPFTRFDEWLDEVEQLVEPHMVLLALDEFEALDEALSAGRFSEAAVLGTLRHLIQHRPRFKVLLAGSHTLDQLQRWASYLINVQLLHLSYLQESEARQLIERPVPDFSLQYVPDASQRIVKLTRCHPYLVQLLGAAVVTLKNEQSPAVRRWAQLADVEAAVPRALGHGLLFFIDIAYNQIDADGRAVLQYVATAGAEAVVTREALLSKFPTSCLQVLALLTRRELVEEVEGGFRFQVELTRRWFAEAYSEAAAPNDVGGLNVLPPGLQPAHP